MHVFPLYSTVGLKKTFCLFSDIEETGRSGKELWGRKEVWPSLADW
jgi:hypothetical protein